MAIINMIDCVSDEQDKKNECVGIFIDLSKALVYVVLQMNGSVAINQTDISLWKLTVLSQLCCRLFVVFRKVLY
jgi:hypothetical protein